MSEHAAASRSFAGTRLAAIPESPPDAALQVRRMSGALGASVEGIDVRTLTDAAFAAVRQAFFDHSVLVIRNQTLGPEEHLAFAARFGRITMTRGTEKIGGDDSMVVALDAHPQILRVRNAGKKLAITEAWHADNCHVERPTSISILAAQELPPAGGDTLFASQYLAYEALSPVMKRLLRGLRLMHFGDTQPGFKKGEVESALIPRFYHPIVRMHPETGRRALFLGGRPGRGHGGIEGMSDSESLALHQFLLDHATQPHFCYRHQWQPGDVVIWDNRCTLHYAVHDYGDAPRNMNRVTIEGEVPCDAPDLD